MKIVFFGTPKSAVTIVDRLNKELKNKGEPVIAAVVTQEPKPVGRKKLLKYSAVDDWAHKRKIPIFFDPEDIVRNNIMADIGISASFGKIIPKAVIDHFPKKIINIHFSLLPKWRGASPIPATLISGESEAGVTIFVIDEKLDHGQIITQFREKILPTDTTESLVGRLFERSAEVLLELLEPYLKGKITLKMQDESHASSASTMQKEDGFIPPKVLNCALNGETYNGSWEIPFMRDFRLVNPGAIETERFIRAMYPWPIAWTNIKIANKSLRLKIHSTAIENEKLVLNEVQLEGKNKVTWKQFLEGYNTAILE